LSVIIPGKSRMVSVDRLAEKILKLKTYIEIYGDIAGGRVLGCYL